MITKEAAVKLTYEELYKNTDLRDGDYWNCVSPDSTLMQSIFEDYREFSRTFTAERIESYSHNFAGITSNASTGSQYVKLSDGTEWYITIYGTRYDAGFDLTVEKRQI